MSVYKTGHTTIMSSNHFTKLKQPFSIQQPKFTPEVRLVNFGNSLRPLSLERSALYASRKDVRTPIKEAAAIWNDLNAKNQQINDIIARYTSAPVPSGHSNSRRTNGEIQRVLERLEKIPTNTVADAARAEFIHRLERTTPGHEYWQEGPSSNLVLRALINERSRLPDILLDKIVGPQEANRLFKSFMDNWNHGLGLLDPRLHSPRTVLQRCPLLFTVVLAIASRDYQDRPDLHAHLMQHAKLSAAAALTDGWKSADTVQALLLMASYPPPVARYTEDRTSLYIGMAVRMALDRNLDRASGVQWRTPEEKAELDNHIRTWRACVLLDRSSAVKFGRNPSIRDIGSLSYAPTGRDAQTIFEIRIFGVVNHFLYIAKSGHMANDYLARIRDANADIDGISDEIRHTPQLEPNTEYGAFSMQLLNLTMDYALMVINSFAFTKELESGNTTGGIYLGECMKLATSSVARVLDRLVLFRQFKYSPDAWFEYASFSAAFLIKLMRPQFANYVDRPRIAGLIKRLVDMYRSPAVALRTDNHLPRLMSQFLENAARNIPEYQQAPSPSGSSRGLSRSPPTTPSPPYVEGTRFDAPPSEVLEGFVWDWFGDVEYVLPGI
ncbi:Fungal specific transcription factor domain [Ceratobasidium sp. AG-Ba]|nr:Fungal specific transcription factor domain [Ceratobasidium sp. AG-Ba]